MNSDRSSDRSSVADYYDDVAETWDKSYGAERLGAQFARQLREHLKLLLADGSGTAHALELGAGTGPYIGITASLFGSVIATDLSEGMLAVFARRLRALGIHNVTLMQQDACELTRIPPESVDVVYSVGLLETVADFDRLFAESYRVLRPGGFVAGVTSNGDCPWYSVRKWLEGGERHARTGTLATAARISDVLSRSGFAPSKIEYWGAAPPGLQSRSIGAVLAAAEAVVAPTPLARYLGVLSFRANKRPL